MGRRKDRKGRKKMIGRREEMKGGRRKKGRAHPIYKSFDTVF